MDYKEKKGIRKYTISYPEKELTSDEVEKISEIIKERLDHALSVKFVYTLVIHQVKNIIQQRV